MLLLGHGRTTLYSHKNRLYAPNKTQELNGVYHVTVCYHTLIKSVMMSVAVSEVGVVLCRVWSEKVVLVEVLVGYLTISTNVNCYQTRCRWQHYSSFSNTAHACTSATQFNSCCAKPQLHFCWAMAPTGQSWIQWITRFKSLQQHDYELQVNKIY